MRLFQRRMNMLPFSLLIFILTFCNVFTFVEPITCPKGKGVRVKGSNKICEDCKDEYFQDTDNFSQKCSACTNCIEESGSSVKEKCTKTKDTVCQCGEGFVPVSNSFILCQCDKGFGLKKKGGRNECSKCEEGYFTTEVDAECKKWTDCKAAGVKTAGTPTSDVICNEQLFNNTQIPTTSTSKTSVFFTFLQTHHGNSNKEATHFTTSTTKPSQPNQNVAHENDLGMSLLLFGIAGLLMLTAVICKLFLTPCSEKRPSRNNNGSCRTPVEESGDPTEKLHKVDSEP